MKNGWISGPIFSEWFTGQLHNELKKYCKAESINFSSLLVLDIVAGHPPVMEALSTHISYFFLPFKTRVLLQTVNRGVISKLRNYYLRETVAKHIGMEQIMTIFLYQRHHRHYS
jgi:hypothetical protein